jgi:preprotein translocase subunit SecD
MTIADPAKVNDARDAVQKKVDLNDTAGWSFSPSGATMTWSLSGAQQKVLGDSATDQAMKIIDSRINAVGVAEPTLQRRGGQNSHEILLQMPGISDPEHVKQLLNRRIAFGTGSHYQSAQSGAGAKLHVEGRSSGVAEQWRQRAGKSAACSNTSKGQTRPRRLSKARTPPSPPNGSSSNRPPLSMALTCVRRRPFPNAPVAINIRSHFR